MKPIWSSANMWYRKSKNQISRSWAPTNGPLNSFIWWSIISVANNVAKILSVKMWWRNRWWRKDNFSLARRPTRTLKRSTIWLWVPFSAVPRFQFSWSSRTTWWFSQSPRSYWATSSSSRAFSKHFGSQLSTGIRSIYNLWDTFSKLNPSRELMNKKTRKLKVQEWWTKPGIMADSTTTLMKTSKSMMIHISTMVTLRPDNNNELQSMKQREDLI